MTALDDLEVKLARVKGYVRHEHGKRILVRPYETSVTAALNPAAVPRTVRGQYVTVPVRADSLRPRDLFVHPVVGTAHRVHHVEPAGADVVIHSHDHTTGEYRAHRTRRTSWIKKILALLASASIAVAGAGSYHAGYHEPKPSITSQVVGPYPTGPLNLSNSGR